MILSDSEIRYHSTDLIQPFKQNQVQPASYDVRLGNEFKVFQRDATPYIDFKNPTDITKKVVIPEGEGFLLHPGEFVLGVTHERLTIPNGLVGRLEGKSSVGRLGLFIHVTAGFIDPGFCGPITLEMLGVHPLPLLIWPGELIAQISFQKMSRPAASVYSGRYQNATGVESSKLAKTATLGDNDTGLSGYAVEPWMQREGFGGIA